MEPEPQKPARVIRLHPNDNVAVAASFLAPGAVVPDLAVGVAISEPIPYGHKVATAPISRGSAVRKYGEVIGFATVDIEAGQHVHSHNVVSGTAGHQYEFAVAPCDPVAVEPRTFLGYPRRDGLSGTRNYVAVISTVNCSAATSRFVAARIGEELHAFEQVDGVIALTHKGGCGMKFEGVDHDQLDRVLGGFARHSNIGAYLIIGLGCEDGQPLHLTASQRLGQVGGGQAPVMTIQDKGGIRKTVDFGVSALRELLPEADRARRVEVPASALVFGTQCGGSDAYSGITANPAVGFAADLIVAQGGKVILGELPEIFGAEHLLTRRAASREVGESLLDRIRWWEWYTGVLNASMDNNPSPGNKEGGLTTIVEKSLGAISKGGTTTLRSVVRYGEPVTVTGLTVMDTPGYDPVSMTGIVAGGANVCAFTTGRGSVYGCKPSPCLKVASNPVTYHRMEDDMDVNAGTILDGASVADVGRGIFELLLEVASGRKTKSEELGLGEDEFAPWVIGPVL